jgi:hypothetical protein
MKIRQVIMIMTAVATMVLVVPSIQAGEVEKKKKKTSEDLVDRMRPADPPVASTGTVKIPVLQPNDHHKPEPKFKEVPPPPPEKKKDDKK